MSTKKHSIRATCLANVKPFNNKCYILLSDLKSDIFQHFAEYGINDKTAILTYKLEQGEAEKLFDNIDLLPKDGSVIDLYVKRVWNNCALCLAPFGITHTQLPLECPNGKCGYQYCNECVDTIRKSSGDCKLLRPFLCMFCKTQSNPVRNHLLEEHILWRDFQRKYDMDNMTSLDSIDFFSYHLILNDLQCRRAHIQSLIDTLSRMATTPKIEAHIDEAKIFIQKFTGLRHRMQKYFDELDEQEERPDDLLRDYQEFLSPDDCARFIETCEAIANSFVTLDLTDCNAPDYKIEVYQSLLAPNNLMTTCDFLSDLTFRRTCLAQLVQKLENLMPTNHPYTSIFNERIHTANCIIDDLEKFEQRINTIRLLYDGIALCLLDYYNLLTAGVNDNRCVPTGYSSFVYMCELLQRLIEQGERTFHFPILTKLMNEWNMSDGCDEQFKPKLVPLFQAIHDDLDALRIKQDLPFRVGIVGYRSSAKSSLLNRLRNIIDDEDPLFSPVALIKSTYCFLQYTVEYAQCQITYVDIEGYDQETFFYERQISRADCDAYIIVFDQTFSRLHFDWKTWIETTLGRPCLLVRCKADTLFLDCYSEVRNKRQYTRETASKSDIKRVLQAMRKIVEKTESNDKLDKIYLVSPRYPHVDERLRGAEFAEFDLNILRDDLINLTTRPHRNRERFTRMAMSVGVHAINVCFRRGYAVSATRYSVTAGILAVIPLLEKVPDYYAREKIRQVLGVRDGDDSLENYLSAYQLHVPADLLQSSVFKYLSRLDNKKEEDKQLGYVIHLFLGQVTTPHQSSTSRQGAVRTGLITISDIAFGCARVAARVLQTAQALTTAVTGVALIFTASMCAWSAISAEHRMHVYLNKICDDIVSILACFIAKQYKNDE